MTDITAAATLAAAWTQRAKDAARDLEYAASAPAFFTAEWTARTEQEYVTAAAWARYWGAQA